IAHSKHLHHIGKSASPDCPHCENIPETVQHFLLLCPHYAHECHALMTALKRQVSSITYLLTNPKATTYLICFVNSTGRLKPMFSDVPPASH
ncbi:hypothetical protein BDR07DRAFT_1287558, partial [Suillus spraguei]